MRLYGTGEVPTAPRRLVAGPLSAELDRGNLRSVRFGDVEIMRGIAFLVRSRSWATYDPVIADLSVTETADAFRVTYRATVRDEEARLDYVARIDGLAEGSLLFHCEFAAVSMFETCRTGFVVLHPAAVAGAPVEIEDADGGRRAGMFPLLIDPVQPLLNLRALTHEAAPGITVTCRMHGDVFEMEDQRNWTDASFKTYVRPLSRPWPYTLPAGSRSTQSVTLRVAQSGPPPARGKNTQPVRIEPGAAIGPMPLIGLGCTPEEARAALPHAAMLARAGIPLLVCRFDPGQGHGAAELRVLRDLAAASGSAIELQIIVQRLIGFAAELHDLASMVREEALVLRAIAVSPAPDLKSTTPGQPWPDCAPLDAVYQAARAAFPGVPLGGGTFAYFTELNRKRPPTDLLDFVTFSTSPLIHAADDRSVMESLEALPSVAASARDIAGGKPFAVGPSAIGMRENPYGPSPLANPGGGRLIMAGADPRQRGLFNAAWTLGYVARFAQGGATRIAVSAPVGAYGIMDANGIFPVFAVVSGCAALCGTMVHAVRSSREQEIASLLAVRPERQELWLANLTSERRSVMLPDAVRGGALHRMAADTTPMATPGLATAEPETAAETVHLDAFSVVRCIAPASAL